MLRVTLRELLLLTAGIAAGLATLKYAGEPVRFVLSNGVLICLMIATVVALADRGWRQAAASGFASCLAIYLVLLITADPGESSRWATTMLMEPLHKAMATTTWFNRETGEEVAFNPSWPVSMRGNIGGRQVPNYDHFMAVGHLLCALLFGYLGSRLAGWIYTRRAKAEPSKV